MPLTQHYHTRDPIENLRVHVTLRKIANAAAAGDAEVVAEGVGRTWDYCFKWQEKKLSTAQQQQRNRNAKSKQRSKKDPKKKKNEAGAADDTEDATEDSDILPTSNSSSLSSVLCSYIDADNYVPMEELTRHVISSDTNNTTPATTHLVGACHHRLPPAQHALVTPRERNTERAWVRHHREESFRCMHIVASFGTSAAQTEALDKALCSIRFYTESGLLSVTPGFSVALLESEKEDPEALTKGPKLSTYHVSIGGAQYEYTLDNANDLLPLVSTTDQQLLRELQIQEERQDAARVAQLLFSGRDGGLHSDEQQQLYYDALKLSGVLKRRLVLVEVVEARDVGCGVIGSSVPVFVELSLHFPCGKKQQDEQQPHWQHRVTGTNKASRSKCDRPVNRTCLSLPRRLVNGSTLTVFNFHTKFDLELCKRTSKAPTGAKDGSEQVEQEDDGDEGSQTTVSPILSLAIFSRDSWGRKLTEGFGELTIPPSAGHYDRFVPIAKPISSVREQMEELFLGVDESEDAITSGSQLSAESTTLHNVNSRLGVQVQSTGASIRVRFNVVDQSPSPSPHPQPQASSHPLTQKRFGAGAGTGALLPHPLPGPLRVVKRSVNEILQSVRLEKRLSQAGTDPSPQSSPPLNSASLNGVSSTVNAVLARLNAVKASLDNTIS